MSGELKWMCAGAIHLSTFQLPSTLANRNVIETSVFNAMFGIPDLIKTAYQ
jgi:hypothetical protein